MELRSIDNRYLLESEIGSGGYATVYLALDQLLNRLVAVKIMNIDVDKNDKNIKMFQQEAMTMAAIYNPNVCKVYATGLVNNNPYLVMEYIKGKSLKEIIYENGFLLLDEVMVYMQQIINGLKDIHALQIVHRDIKPQNMIKKSDGCIVLLDFGTAFISDEKENLYQEDGKTITGTAHYMAPEFYGSPKGSIQTDIYALGISMFEMLTGKLPFTSPTGNGKEVFEKQINEPLPSIRLYNSTIPVSIENVINKCCDKNPKNRYKDVSELYDELIKAYNESKIVVEPKKTFFERLFKKK